MKISILILYWNRRKLLINTLNSILNYSKGKDLELVIIDDASNDNEKIDDLVGTYSTLNIVLHKFTKEEKTWGFPAIPINKGVSLCTGDVILLQGAEIFHNGDILGDIENRIKPNDYLVYACFALIGNHYDLTGNGQNYCSPKNGVWHQHSIHSPRCLNFCVALSREDMLDIGGFDERYGVNGTNYGDDDFLLRVKRKGMNIIQIDNPYTYHQDHPWGKIVTNRELYLHVLNNEIDYKVKNSFL